MPLADAHDDRSSQPSTPDDLPVDRERLELARLASLSRLARGLAHDFNNFLMVILGQAEIGQLTTPADSPARAQFDQIRIASLRAADLCRQLTTYAGQAPLSLAAIDLAALLTEIAAEIRPSLPPNCELRCVWSAEQLPSVEADRPQLRAAITAAIRNAGEALPPAGGTITLTAATFAADESYLQGLRPAHHAQPGSFVCVEVIDDGCGMNAETLACSFDPFFSTKKARPGMGLSTLLGIIRSHRGAVQVESTLARGTTVRMLLPVASNSPELAARLRQLLGE